MKIKTTSDIFFPINKDFDLNERWVSVDSEIKFLEELYERLYSYPPTEGWNITHTIKDKIKKLKGEQE